MRNGYFLASILKHIQRTNLKDILNYLFPNNSFVIEDLPLRENYQFKAFKIGVDWRSKDNLLNEEIWPAGVEIMIFFGNPEAVVICFDLLFVNICSVNKFKTDNIIIEYSTNPRIKFNCMVETPLV